MTKTEAPAPPKTESSPQQVALPAGIQAMFDKIGGMTGAMEMVGSLQDEAKTLESFRNECMDALGKLSANQAILGRKLDAIEKALTSRSR